MTNLPSLLPMDAKASDCRDGVVLAVYAPLGTDPVLSSYPGDKPVGIRKQELLKSLKQVARKGIHVSALIDVYDDDSYLVEIPAGQPQNTSIHSAWKQDMTSPHALAGFLRRTHHMHPGAALVLALEGHGAGFVPDIDLLRVKPSSTSRWTNPDQSTTQVRWVSSESQTTVEPEPGSPPLGVVSPELGVVSPELPTTRMTMSTYGLGQALRMAVEAGVQRPAVIHFNNCFNMSMEVLHTVAPYADFATSYCNYNFFTAGATYPKVFERLRRAGAASREDLARWFAAENAAALRAQRNHPTIGAMVALARMKPIAAGIQALATALVKALDPTGSNREAVRQTIRAALVAAQHYDTAQGYELAVPDQLVDIGSLAIELGSRFPSGPIQQATAALLTTLAQPTRIWQYGDRERPYMDETKVWNFRNDKLAMNILCPDPDLRGSWDWRSPYYLSGTVDPTKPPAHRHVIDFLADRSNANGNRIRPPWVEFILEYHRGADRGILFAGLTRALPPLFPKFDRAYKPKYPPLEDGDDGDCPPDDPKGGGPGQSAVGKQR